MALGELFGVKRTGSPGLRAKLPPSWRFTADEIARLHGLMEKGVITQAEFEAQKAKILGM